MGFNLFGMGIFIFFGCICVVVGWGVIEFILWLFSFIYISIV